MLFNLFFQLLHIDLKMEKPVKSPCNKKSTLRVSMGSVGIAPVSLSFHLHLYSLYEAFVVSSTPVSHELA